MKAKLVCLSLLAASGLVALVPTTSAHFGPQPCTDSTSTHVYYGPEGVILATSVNAKSVREGVSGVITFDTCSQVVVTLNGDSNPGPGTLQGDLGGIVACATSNPTGDVLVLGSDFEPVPPGNSLAQVLVDTANPLNSGISIIPGCTQPTGFSTGDLDSESGINGGHLPGGAYAVSCGWTNHHVAFGTGASAYGLDHTGVATIVFSIGSDGPVDDPTTGAPVAPCQTDGTITANYNTEKDDCHGELGVNSPGVSNVLPPVLVLSNYNHPGFTDTVTSTTYGPWNGANWENPDTSDPARLPGSTSPTLVGGVPISECSGWNGLTWFFIWPGTLEVPAGSGNNYASTPVVGDIIG